MIQALSSALHALTHLKHIGILWGSISSSPSLPISQMRKLRPRSVRQIDKWLITDLR